MSVILEAIHAGQTLARDLREHEKGTEHRPARTAEEQFVAGVNAALKHERGWVPVLLTRADQQLGGMILINDVNLFEKVVALIDSRCGGGPTPLQQLEPTEEQA